VKRIRRRNAESESWLLRVTLTSDIHFPARSHDLRELRNVPISPILDFLEVWSSGTGKSSGGGSWLHNI
jgi:hypothetical protein